MMSFTKPEVHNVTHRRRRGPSHAWTKIGKDRACDSGDILADRRTHRQTHTQRNTHHNTSHPL